MRGAVGRAAPVAVAARAGDFAFDFAVVFTADVAAAPALDGAVRPPL